MQINRLTNLLIISIAVVVILIYGQSLLVPFICAWLVWFLIREITKFLNRASFIRKHVPHWLNSLLASLLIFGILSVITRILSDNIQNLARAYPSYQSNIRLLTDQLVQWLNVDIEAYVTDLAGKMEFGKLLASIFNSLTDIIGNAVMIVIYVLFIFIEEAYFMPKLKAVFDKKSEFETVYGMLGQIGDSITHYVGLKTFVSVITGGLGYIVLMIIGVQAPFFWAFLLFLLNFIPTVGSLIGTLFPTVFALLQFGEFLPAVYVLVFVGAIQLLVGNVLEPKLMGNSLNISPLVTILSLSFWGAIWGITGMIMSVPITVILVLVFAHFPQTRPIAIMLSEKGQVTDGSNQAAEDEK
ncbi:MAG: AI-2E family transporter [Flavobacteriales bacterium]|nr:AI-2E family transporter [Flavobacteriales bacterium]MCB9448175.1 AI-2E family transporter [Flavobacteriales bacterium]